MGMRNPIYATSMGLIQYAASLDDVHRIAQKGKLTTETRVTPLASPSRPVAETLHNQLKNQNEVEATQETESENFGDK